MSTKIDLYNSKLEKSGTVESNVDYSPEVISVASVHQVVKAILSNKRQGTASTKNRALVRGGGAKPFKQKGTGNARRGSSRSPLLVGGGTAFGPTPRSFRKKINKKMALKATQSVIADKIKEDCFFLVESFDSTGKTKDMNELLRAKDISSALVVSGNYDANEVKATRNLKRSFGIGIDGFNVYLALKYKNLIMTKDAFEKISSRLEK